MKVSVIIVNYFTAHLCQECLASIAAKSDGVDYEVIIVDNSNDNAELKLLSQVGKPFGAIIMPAGGNLGFGGGNNLGAQKASGDYLFFLNADTIVLNNALNVLASFLDDHPEVGIVGPNIFDAKGNPYHSYIKNQFTAKYFIKENSLLRMIKRSLTKRRTDFNYLESPVPVNGYICGAALMIRRDAFEKLGGFDTHIFMYAEEALLCHQCQEKLGLSLYNCPSAKIVHLEGKSFNRKTISVKAKHWSFGNYYYFRTAFGPEEALYFLRRGYRVMRRKYLLSRLLFKKKKGAYYREFMLALEELKIQSKATK